MSATPTSPSPSGPPWRARETWIVVLLVAAFFVVGLRSYRDRRLIADAKAVQASMRMFALALNTYQANEGMYPSADLASGEGRLSGLLPTALTTPVAYANRLLTDPFNPEEGDARFFYLRREDAGTTVTAGDARFDAFVRDHIGEPVGDVDYVFWGRGPDGDLDTVETADGTWTTVRYDPTNGSNSDGDLHFWGPAIGIRRNPYLGTSAAGRGGLR